jgi:hypothetical protein
MNLKQVIARGKLKQFAIASHGQRAHGCYDARGASADAKEAR